MTAPDLMTALGYACLGRDPAMQDCQLWLKQCGPRGLLVSLPVNAPADDVAEALHDAGARDKHDEIAGRYKAFTDALKFPGVSEVWQRARALQAQQQNALALAGSMPKEQPPTVKL
jgi:uncharacterized protein YbjT (DUF2867 family)